MTRIALCCFFAAGLTLLAQSNYNQQISGQVQDSTGSVVPNATVTATETQTGLSRVAPTNDSGNYVISNLPIGKYNVTAEAKGFKKAVLSAV